MGRESISRLNITVGGSMDDFLWAIEEATHALECWAEAHRKARYRPLKRVKKKKAKRAEKANV